MKIKLNGTVVDKLIMNLFSQSRKEIDVDDLEIALCHMIEKNSDMRNEQIKNRAKQEADIKNKQIDYSEEFIDKSLEKCGFYDNLDDGEVPY